MHFGILSGFTLFRQALRLPGGALHCINGRLSISVRDNIVMCREDVPKNSHRNYFENRNWEYVSEFWTTAVLSRLDTLPVFVSGDREYGVVDLQKISESGKVEYASKDLRYQKRKNYAISVGYDGKFFNGFQKQKELKPSATVEGERRI
jgi:hypothetical protein